VIMNVEYRFPKIKDASWNSFNRQKERYECIKPFLGLNSIGAEIGVYKGGFGEFLRKHTNKLYLIDPWYRLKPFWGDRRPENSAVEAFIYLLTIYKEEIENQEVEVVPEFSVQFLKSKPENYFDWIYLDASHRYESTIEEIKAALYCIKDSGYLLGDDYDPDPSSNQHGVFLAVNEVIKEYGFDLVLNASRQWGIKVVK
jgi:hypothetical protein